MWSINQISQHLKAAELIDKIAKEAFFEIGQRKKISEFEVQTFILDKFRKNKLKTDHAPIVAFRENTAFVHYYPQKKGSKEIRKESLIMIDLWARLKEPRAPFADITLMGYYGNKVPKEFSQAFQSVARARDKCIYYLKKSLREGYLPKGWEIDKISRDYLGEKDLKKNFLHGTGHSLGFTSPHGNLSRISPRGRQTIKELIAYTIEPGIYFKNKFGIRSEIDFYINKENQLILTSYVQKKILHLKIN